MIIHVFQTEAQVARAAAALLTAQLLRKKDSVLGLATGSTPILTYRELIGLHRERVLDLSQAVSFNLDEYIGLPEGHRESYHAFMKRHLFDHVSFREHHLPNGLAADLDKECRRYDALIASAGGIDLQLLGIGNNGHIGFNEPDDCFIYGTHVVSLSPSTLEANRPNFDPGEEVPSRAVTQGIGAIMQAGSILFLAVGESKAEAVRAMAEDEITPRMPASVLRLHREVTVLLDQAAAGRLKNRDVQKTGDAFFVYPRPA
jgi:glucosamine-6-phosphate deaminase